MGDAARSSATVNYIVQILTCVQYVYDALGGKY